MLWISSVQIRQHFMPSRQITCNVKPHFAEIRKILWKCYLLNMLSAWRFNPWHGRYTFCCHVDAFCYLISDQVATTCYLRKKLISNTVLSIHFGVIPFWNLTMVILSPLYNLKTVHLMDRQELVESLPILIVYPYCRSVHRGGAGSEPGLHVVWWCFIFL